MNLPVHFEVVATLENSIALTALDLVLIVGVDTFLATRSFSFAPLLVAVAGG
jgi:hypothetical protein